MLYTAKLADGTEFGAPISKVVCVGRNYAEHAKELNNPVPSAPILFIKPESTVADLQAPFAIPDSDCHYEVELAVLIGKPLSKASNAEVDQSIAGLGLALDLTRRDLQSKLKEKSHPWEAAKSFDGACPVSSFVSRSEFSNLEDIQFSLTINGELRQSGVTADMLTPVIPLIAHMSEFFALRAGDIVLTGTPKGVGRLEKGDKLSLNLADKLVFDTLTV